MTNQATTQVTVDQIAKSFMDPIIETNFLGQAMEELDRVLPLEAPGGNPDFYAEQVNGYGIALLKAQHFSLAEQLWRFMARRTVAWRTDHAWPENLSSWRHAGGFYGNAAIACALQGKVEDALILWIRGAKDDEITHYTPLMDTCGIKDLCRTYLKEPTLDKTRELISRVVPAINRQDLDVIAEFLGEQQFELLVYLHKLVVCVSESFTLHHPLMDDLVFQGFRNIGPFVDRHLKTLADERNLPTRGTMQTTITALYSGKPGGLGTYQADHERLTMKPGPGGGMVHRTIREQCEEVFKLPTATPLEQFVQSLHFSHLVRNHAAHDGMSDTYLLRTKIRQAIAHMLYVLKEAKTYA